MSNLQLTQTKTDVLGATASVLCLIHCLATPYLFIAGAGVAANHEEGPAWWGMIDLVLLVVSLFSVYWSTKKSSKQWMKYALYATWVVLAFIIFNKKFEGIRLPEEMIYIPAVGLTLLHLYNRKFCQCVDDQCCATPEK